MNIFERIKKEISILPMIRQGYSRRMSNYWYVSCLRDAKRNSKKYSASDIKRVQKMGYFASSIPKYNLLNKDSCKFITDFEYIFLNPFNNSFSKWIEDMITTNRVLKDYRELLQPIYFSIVKRDGERQVYKFDHEDREYTADDIIELLMEKEQLVLRPSEWISNAPKYRLAYRNGYIYVNKRVYTRDEFVNLISELGDEKVVVGDYPQYFTAKDGEKVYHYIRLYVTNELDNGDKLLEAIFYIHRKHGTYRMRMNLEKGTFVYHSSKGTFTYTVPNWDSIIEKVGEVTEALTPLSYFAVDLVVNDEGFTIINFSANPTLPGIQYGDKLNDFLKERFAEKKSHYTFSLKGNYEQLKKSLGKKFLIKIGRKGVRDYMQKLWMTAVKNDLKGTKLPLRKKIWAWKRGFISYHIYQYGLTEENYKNYLSDYDYHWLNRINNNYQKWINDKTTFRFILDPFKDAIPKYYYSFSNTRGEITAKIMQDCPYPDMDPKEGLFRILEDEKKLALKASAGTHGDGFYCMAYENGKYYLNNDEMTRQQIIDKIKSFKSYYIVTQWINLHHDLKEIYPNSVSSIRMMVINRHGYDPKITQTYIRIGSTKTGFTDNVGYGGICAMIDPENGEIYQPETIVDHVYYPCPTHPDTGTVIGGRLIPCWDEAKKLVLDISRYMPEMEYLGYDVAITEDGPQIIEINIHQDLHKCNTFSKEIMDFFNDKIAQKKAKYGLS